MFDGDFDHLASAITGKAPIGRPGDAIEAALAGGGDDFAGLVVAPGGLDREPIRPPRAMAWNSFISR